MATSAPATESPGVFAVIPIVTPRNMTSAAKTFTLCSSSAVSSAPTNLQA